MIPVGRRIASGREFDVYECGESELLKIPRHPRLMNLVFGNFRRKNEADLQFLQAHFAEFLPATAIVDLSGKWGIRQQRVAGMPFFERPRMSPSAHRLLSRAAALYRETGRIPDLLNPGNLVWKEDTDTLFLIDTSVLGGTKRWPCGYWVSRFLARVLSDTIHRWLRSGF
jgi:hypothetical protein